MTFASEPSVTSSWPPKPCVVFLRMLTLKAFGTKRVIDGVVVPLPVMPSNTRFEMPFVKTNVPPAARGVVYVTSANPLTVHGGVGVAVGDGAGLGDEGAVCASLRANEIAISATNTSAPVKTLRKDVSP